jgi:hypothetical protein
MRYYSGIHSGEHPAMCPDRFRIVSHRRTAIVARALLLFMLLAAIVARPVPAQERDASSGRTPRSRVLAIVGVLAGGLIGLGFSFASDQHGHGRCGAVSCAIYAGAAGGGILGFFVGHEYDRNFTMYYRGATPLQPPSVAANLAGTPTLLAVRDGLVAVGGSAGVQTFHSTGTLAPEAHRGGGLHGIDALDIALDSGRLVLGSAAGLYLFPPRQGRGTLIRSGAVGAAASSRDHVYFGVDDRIEVAPLLADTVRGWPGVALDAPLRDAELDTLHHVLWGLTDRALVAFRVTADSLARLSRTPIVGGGSRLAIEHDRAAIALGERGVLLVDIANPAAPRPIARWTSARFAYDVSLDSTRMFVAAGPEGVYVVDVGGTTPRTIGLARSLGFATALVSRGGHTYILDRRENVLRRIPSDF